MKINELIIKNIKKSWQVTVQLNLLLIYYTAITSMQEISIWCETFWCRATLSASERRSVEVKKHLASFIVYYDITIFPDSKKTNKNLFFYTFKQ